MATGRADSERFREQRLASRGNWYVYVLELGESRFAVGHTQCLSQRLHDHFRGCGSAWTKKHSPLRVLEILRTSEAGALGLEEAKCMEYKLAHGWNSTRGGTWNSPEDHPPPRWWKDGAAEGGENFLG